MNNKIVLVFGTYEIFHPGHEFFLKKAKTFGDLLYIVVSLDETVVKVKGKPPRKTHNERKETLEIKEYVDKVFLGNPGDKYKIIEEIRPDIICLGYDQEAFTKNLRKEIDKRGMQDTKIVRIEDSYEPDKYKSSKL